MRLALVVMLVLAAVPSAARAQQPLGIVDQTLARFDRDTLAPDGPSLEVPEPHTAPVLSPDRERLVIGVSTNPEPGAPSVGRVGVFVVDAQRMAVVHAIQAGIAAEAVAYPGVVAAVLQDGRLIVVDPESGAITYDAPIGHSRCAPEAVQVGRTAVFVNEVFARGVEVTTVGARGRVRSARIPLEVDSRGGGCYAAALVADPARRRVLVAGATRVAAVTIPSLRPRSHRIGDRSPGRTAELVRGRGLAVAGRRGLRVLD
ncbi:MAG TPA: hypothetical protein VGW10_18015, partial [Solirubrobacteraceae bacterium]|nr:hypothetical protein [Solirubrobacteraceae bacterium]